MRLLLCTLAMAALALAFPAAADSLPPRPHGFTFYRGAPLDIGQVEDRRGQVQENCVYAGGRAYCTWRPMGGGCASTCVNPSR